MTHVPSVHTTYGPLVNTSSVPQVHTTSALAPDPIHDALVHPTVLSTNHDLPHEEVQRDANGKVIIRPVGKGYAHFFIHILVYG